MREAVAARARRRLRDGVLLLLLLVFAVTSSGTAVLWLMVALVGVSITAVGEGISRRKSLVVLAVTVGLFVVLQREPGLLGFVFLGADPFGQLPTTGFALTATLGLLILAVLVADAFTVSHLVNNRFQRGEFKADAQDARSELERTVRGLGQGPARPGRRRERHERQLNDRQRRFVLWQCSWRRHEHPGGHDDGQRGADRATERPA